MTALAREDVLLLLRLLESAAPRYSHSALVDFYGAKGEALISSGLLRPTGLLHPTNADDEFGNLITVVFDENRAEFGFHDPTRGWVTVNQDTLGAYRPDIARIITHLLPEEVRVPSHGVSEVSPGTIWEVGDIRLSNRHRSSVWFARRLHDHTVAEGLEAAVARRPSTSLRLILTSTPSNRLLDIRAPFCRVVPIFDVLSSMAAGRIDVEILKARFAGRPPPPLDQTVHLSDDGTALTINGAMEIRFRGKIQVEAIRRIVKAYQSRQRFVASKLLRDAGSSGRTLHEAFGPRWIQLKPFMRNEAGVWWLDP